MARTYEDIKNRKKKKDEEKSSQSVSVSESRNDRIARKRQEKAIGFDSFETDLNSLGGTLSDIGSKWQTAETMNNTKASVESMYNRIGAYQDYRTKYGNDTLPDLSELHDAYKSALDGWDDQTAFYGQYENADAFNKALEAEEAEKRKREKMGKEDLNIVKTEITELENILEEANKRNKTVQIYENKANAWEHRSKGLNTDGGNGVKKESAQQTLDEYLKSVGYSDIDSIEKALGEKKVYLNQAQRIQDGIALSAVSNKYADNYDADFEAYVAKGKEIGGKKGKWYESTPYPIIYRRNDEEFLKAYEESTKRQNPLVKSVMSDDLNKIAAIHMTDEEFDIYSYYVGKGDDESAEKYLHAIEEQLMQRQGVSMHEDLSNPFKKYSFGITAGTDQFVQGSQNVFNTKDDYIPLSGIQNASGMNRADISREHGFLGTTGYDMITTTANMAPSVIASTISDAVLPGSGAFVGATLMGTSASGGAYQEMLNLGYDKGQARTYSALVGASEAALQYAFGGISKLGGKITGKTLETAISGIDNAFLKFAANYGRSAISEGFEESVQEILNPLFMNVAAGYDTGAEINWGEVVYSGLLGALSGGVMDAPQIAIKTYGEKKTGKNIRANERTADMLNLVSMTPQESEAYNLYTRYANKGVTADNITDTQLGSLYSTAMDATQRTLKSKKSTEEQKKSATNALRDLSAYAQKPSRVDTSIFDAEDVSALVEQGLESTEDTESYKLATEYKSKLESGKKLSKKEISKLVEANERAFKSETKTDVESMLTELGEEGDVASVADAIAKKESGAILSTAEIEALRSSQNGRMILNGLDAEGIKAVKEELNSVASTMDKAEAKLYTSLYDGSASVDDYTTSFNLATEYTKNKFSQDTMLKNKGVLTEAQVGEIYSTIVKEQIQLKQDTIDELNGIMGDTMSYNGIIDDTVIDYDNANTKGKVNWSDLKPRQREAITFIKGFAKATGMNLRLTTEGMKKNYNGAFVVKGNTIVLDIYAGIDKAGTLKDTLIPTMSHETTHWMKGKSPLLYRKLDELVFKSLEAKDGISEEERVAREMFKLKKDLEKEVTAEEARDEIIARACEDMLSMSEEGKKLFNSLSESEKKTFVDKIKDIIASLKDWITDLLSTYEARSDEAMLLREYDEALNEISKLWDEMLADAVKGNQALESAGAYGHTATVESVTIGARDMSEFSEAKGIDGEALFQYRAIEADKEIYRDMLLNHKDSIGITEKQINDLFRMIDKAVDVVSHNLEALDYGWEVDIDDRAFMPIKPNSDSLYKVSLDFSTLCRKRLLQQTIQATLQKALNKHLSKEESIAIRDELIKIQEEGRKIEVACALCYVESARMKSPVQINKFLNNREAIIREFFAGRSGGSIKEKIKIAEDKAREELFNANPDGLEGKNGAILDARTAKLNKMYKADAEFIRDAKRTAKASYVLTEHEQAELDYAMKLSTDEFTSADGLESLAKNHHDLFDAYVSFVRNATHSKGIEKDTWWRAGDSALIGDNLIKQMNAENGLRSQSWSDFQVIHLLDYIAATIELSAKGAKRQSYTKVPDYVKLLGNTGDMINMSLIPTREFDGKLGYDDVEGMPYKTAKDLRKRYHETSGIICIGIEDTQIRMLLADDTIDMVIPYHKSSMSQAVKKLMHIPDWRSYEEFQSEKKLSDDEAEARAKEYGVALKKDSNYQKAPNFSEWFNLEEARQIAKKENAHPSDIEAYKKYGVMYGGYKAMQKAADKYLKLCAERGLSPKFSHPTADFTHEANYWKLLIDRKMVDNVTGDIIEQKAIKPIFNEKHILEILNDELERYPQVKADQDYAASKVTEKFLSGQMKVDDSTLEAIKKPVDNVAEVNILESADVIQYQRRESVSEITEEDYTNIKNHFGVTGNYNVAGYMLTDGKMLDFSGKHWGDTSSTFRQVDHRDIQEVLESDNNGVDSLVRMIGNGNIRLMPETGGINLAVAPSKNQRIVLRRYIEYMSRKEGIVVDIDEVGGDTIKSFTYDKGVSADRVMRDIDNYFKGRIQSELMQFHMMGDDVQYSIREEAPPKHTVKGYKVFVVIDGKLYPPMVANPNGADTPVGVWLNADVGVSAPDSKTGRKQVKAGGKGTQGGSGSLAFRPGWHLGEVPIATQFNRLNPDTGVKELFPENFVWAECDVAADVDYQEEAMSYGYTENGKFRHSYAGLPRLPIDGYYKYRTNPNPETVPWLITGAMKVNRVLSDAEVAEILRTNNIEPPKRQGGEKSLKDLGLERFEGEVYQLRENPSVHDLMGETERLQKENEQLKKDFEDLQKRLEIEKELTHGNYFNENQLGAVAGHLRNISNSLYSKDKLMEHLREVYSYIAHSDTAYFEEMFDMCYDIAVKMLNEAKPKKEIDNNLKLILKDIENTRISLNKEQIAEAKHRFGENYHKHFFGRVTIASDGISLDSKWSEWSAMYPSFFKADTNSGDQITELYDILNDLKDASEIVVQYDADEEARWLATEIYNQYWNVSAFKSTADKYDNKIRKLNFEHRRRMTELRENYNARVKGMKEKLKEQKLADEIGYGRVIAELRRKRETEVAKAKEHGKERLAQYKENAERKARIQRITANALTLNDKHIHEIMREPVIELLNAIDFSSKRMLEKGVPTKTDISLSKALGKVKDMMKDASDGKVGLEDLYGHQMDEDIRKMVESVDNIMRTVGDNEFVLNKMSLEDLQTLDKIVRTIKQAVTNLNKFHVVNHAKGIANLSQESVLFLDSLGKGKVYDGIRGSARKLLNWGNALPYHVFKRFGKGGEKVYEALQDGWDKFSFNIKKTIDYAKETYTEKEVKEWSKEIKAFKILVPTNEVDMTSPDYKPQYQTVQMTVPQIMSLYCLQKREQAKGHLIGGGIRVADFKDIKGKIVSQSDGVILTEKDIVKIIDSLTERQRAVADKLQLFMNNECAEWGNEVSMLRFGYRAFGEENYFPIQSDKNNLSVNDETEQDNSLFRLLNMSFTKSTDEKANNRVIISDIFDVFAQHTSDMAKYNALALPVLDAFKWYNYTEKQYVNDTNFKTKGVKQSIESAFGKDGQNYFTTFLKDINGTQEVSRDVFGNRFFTNAKIAAVGANLRVMFLQPTSYLRASAVIDNKYLVKALVHKPKIAKSIEHCGIALWKSMGYYDTNIQRGVKEQIKHDISTKDKLVEKSMKGAEWADKVTWGYLWNACELEVRENRKDLKVGSDEFYAEISKRLREVIYSTQVVDSVMTRSQMMRSADGKDKMLTAFASEPTLAYNMLQDAYMSYALDARKMGKKEAVKKNSEKIARVLTAYTMTNVFAAVIESAFDAFRDDDEEEKDFEYFIKLYLTNFLSDMSITGKIPYIKEAHSIIKGFGSSRSDTQWMETFIYSAKSWYKFLSTGKNPAKAIKQSIKTVSDLLGLPFYNAYRDAMALLHNLDLFTEEDLNEMFGDFFN